MSISVVNVPNRGAAGGVRTALIGALYEYLLVTLPVGVYVALEALEKDEVSFLWSSPEWAIATIFLSFQGMSLYSQELRKTGRRLSASALGIFALGALMVVVGASINAYQSLHENGTWAVRIRLALFALASIGFSLFVASARLAHLHSQRGKDGNP